MKKVLSIVLAVCLCLTFIVVLVGCTPKYDTKTTIVIEPYGAAGYGLKWLDKLATEWTEQGFGLQHHCQEVLQQSCRYAH